MTVTIRNIGVVILLLFVSSGQGQTQSSPQKAQQKAPAPAQAQKLTSAGPDEVVPPAAPDALFPAIVARVNGKAVLGRDLEQRIQSELSGIGSPAWNNLRQDYRDELTNRELGFLVASELLYQNAGESGIKVTDAEVQAEFAKVAKSFSSDAEMNTQLAKRGTDRAGLTKDLARDLVVSKYIEETFGKKTVISPAEVQQYYSAHASDFQHPEVVRTSHILILVPERATADQEKMAQQRAEALLQRVKKGEDFAKLAKENSMDGSASQGGDIGFVPRGQLASEYEQVAFSLPTGGVSDLVRTQFGYHIIKVTDRKKEGVSTLDEVRSDLIEFLKNQKVRAEVAKQVDALRTKAKIEVYIPVGAAKTPADATVSSPRP